MILTSRIGNKIGLASEITSYFPSHSTYIELFFGSGGLFFNKRPIAKYNILNDIDSNIYNCFDVLLRKEDELLDYMEMIPYDSKFWEECIHREPDSDVEKAVYFLVLNGFSLYNDFRTLVYPGRKAKNMMLQKIKDTYKFLVKSGNTFMNEDFRNVIPKLSLRDEESTFIYSDPPYFETGRQYKQGWNKKDVIDCFEITFNSGMNGAMSEFDHPFILQKVKELNLNIYLLGERNNIKNRRNEILITNYKNNSNFGFK